ncbi:MAG: hypothetical protein JW779_11330, partial [Candidatus Thorarchaeota archaeon]|nr:hypothetical protein [Candidatus Thorarchaeota archaeon]
MNRILEYLEMKFRKKRKLRYRHVVFASSLRISGYEDIAKDFLPRICNQRREDCWISDYSSLWDFLSCDDKEAILERIQSEYGIDVRDIEDGNLLLIFDR